MAIMVNCLRTILGSKAQRIIFSPNGKKCCQNDIIRIPLIINRVHYSQGTYSNDASSQKRVREDGNKDNEDAVFFLIRSVLFKNDFLQEDKMSLSFLAKSKKIYKRCIQNLICEVQDSNRRFLGITSFKMCT